MGQLAKIQGLCREPIANTHLSVKKIMDLRYNLTKNGTAAINILPTFEGDLV